MYHDEYEWYLLHRLSLPLLFGAWGDPRAIPTLFQALRASWEFERSNSLGGPSDSHRHHLFQDKLAYALGQLGAWNIRDELYRMKLPSCSLHLTQVYMALGSLQVDASFAFDLKYVVEPWDGLGDPESLSEVFGFVPPLADPTMVTCVLRERFGFTVEESEMALGQFLQWFRERDPHSALF